ncbi:MAG: DUF305 domain-containing protein [Nakamurella sp.]
MTIRTRRALIAGITLSLLVLAACGATTSTPGATAPPPHTNAASSTAVSSGGMPMPSTPAGPHNQADITFASMMIVHHKGAIQMAELAPTRAASSQVKDLAVKIKAAQAPEITEMSGWLTAWTPGTDMNGMPMNSTNPSSQMSGMSGMGNGSNSAGSTSMPSMSTMPGMMSDQQMSQLTAASGATFDKLFLQLMTVHHQGALTMSQTEKKHGSNPEALKLADSITVSQTAEIATMQKLLTTP